MHPLHAAALQARLRLTTPLRIIKMREMCRQSSAPMSVLFYHRVANTNPNPWTISRREFRRHFDYCRENFDLIGLDEVQHRMRQGRCDRPTVTFTFDDGYAENSDFALPLLIRHRVPCVYFVTVTNIKTQQPFPHDVAAGSPLPTNTVHQLREAIAGGIEIGLHTSTHIDFSKSVDDEVVRREIIDAKDALEQLIGQRVRYFAVPFGLPQQMTPAVIDATREAGLVGICSAYGAYNFPMQDAFHIRRIHGDPEFTRLRNWLTFDARKLKHEPVVPVFDPIDASMLPMSDPTS